jgi:hypothetical protein
MISSGNRSQLKITSIIMDLPPAHDHDDHGSGVDPMHDPNRQRMQAQPMPSI